MFCSGGSSLFYHHHFLSAYFISSVFYQHYFITIIFYHHAYFISIFANFITILYHHILSAFYITYYIQFNFPVCYAFIIIVPLTSISQWIVMECLVYHVWCGFLMYKFKARKNVHGHLWFRIFNEVPVVLLIIIILLAVFKPF